MKYYGRIAYSYRDETEPGIYDEGYHEQYYYGDVDQIGRRLENQSQINDDVKANVSISVLADADLNNHFGSIRWVEFMGQKWKAETVNIKPPRLNIILGALYHEGGAGNG